MGYYILNQVFAVRNHDGETIAFPLCEQCAESMMTDGGFETFEIKLAEHNRKESCDCGLPIVSSPMIETQSVIAGYGNRWVPIEGRESI